MIEFQSLRLDHKNNYKTTKTTKSLANLISSNYKISEDVAFDLIKKTMDTESKNPVLFFRKIENDVQKP